MTRRRGLGAHILLRVLPWATLALLAVALVTMVLTRATVERAALDWLERENQSGLLALESRIAEVVSQARFLAGNDLLVNSLVDTEFRENYLPTFFQSLRVSDDGGEHVMFTDYKGRPIVSKRASHAPILDRSEWVARIARGEDVVSISAQGLFVAVPVKYNGLPEGGLVIEYDVEHMQQILEVAHHGSEMAILDADGTALHTSSQAFVAQAGQLSDPAGRWITSESPFTFNDDGLRLVTAQEKGEAFAVLDQVNGALAVAFVFALAALVFGIDLSARVAARQVDHLGDMFRRIRNAHDLGRRVEESGPWELASLAREFNAMLEALRATTTSRDYVDGVISSMSQALVVTTTDGKISSVNPAALACFDRRGIGVPETLDEAIRPDDSAASAGDTPDTLDVAYPTVDGDEMWLRWSRSPLRIGDGDAQGLVFLGDDITARRRAERMKREFVSTVSHELRTPLTSIKGSLGLIRAGVLGEVPDKVRDMVDIAFKNSDRLVLLVNDILDVEKLEAGKLSFAMARVDVSRCIASALEENGGYAEEHDVKLATGELAPAAEVWGDANRLMQVLANLLSNAVKFSPEGETVVVESARIGPMVRVSVRDHGPGVPEALRERIFERFSQGDSSDTRLVGGTGLGLSIVKTIVEHHGGVVDFEDAPGGGTRFHVDLPVHAPRAGGAEDLSPRPRSSGVDREARARGARLDAPAGSADAGGDHATVRLGDRATTHMAQGGGGGAARALHVEDEPDVVQIVSTLLAERVRVSRAGTLGEARSLLDEDHFDVIILDLGLPDGEGEELLHALEAWGPAAPPVIVLSARTLDPDTATGVHCALLKSRASNEALAEAVQSALEQGPVRDDALGSKPPLETVAAR